MRTSQVAVVAILACLTPILMAQSSGSNPRTGPFSGYWEGKMSDLPGIDLQIDATDGRISGSALLYFQVGGALPLLAPHGEGRTLTFETERHKCSQCEELVSNAKFVFELTGENEASLWMLDESGNHSGPEVKFKRRTDSSTWKDPSKHHVQFIIVEYGVRVEVLDWGGTGRPIILLAGSGNTAHIFDDFAPKLTAFGHVYGITRRGYGESSHPDAGYTEERLAEDVLEVIHWLKLSNPILVGHSAAGEELTRLGDEHSDRLGGLVYLDAAADPTDFPASSPEYMALYRNLPPSMRDRAPASASDRKNFKTYRDWQERSDGVAFPESELRSMFAVNGDGSVGEYKASTSYIQNAFANGALKRDYSRIRVPVMAFFGVACSRHPQGDYTCISHPNRKNAYEPSNAEERAAKEAFDAATAAYVDRWKKNLQSARGGVRIVDLPGANHYIFISDEAEVLAQMRTFLTRLR